MSKTERIVIYAALVLLAAIELPQLLESVGPPAYAAPLPALADDHVGPYSSLALAGSSGDLVLRSREGRLAWRDDDYARANSMAFVHLGKAMGPLLETDLYVDERERIEAEIREIDEDLVARMETFRQAHINDDPSQPEDPDVRAQRETLVREYEGWNRERARRIGALGARQIEASYRDIVAAVEVVSDKLEIDVVYRFIPTAEDFRATTPAQAYMAVRARTAIRYPQGLDITDQVLEELALDVE